MGAEVGTLFSKGMQEERRLPCNKPWKVRAECGVSCSYLSCEDQIKNVLYMKSPCNCEALGEC